MSNLQTNTTDLQSILDAVNALPDAVDTSGVTATAGHVLAGDKFVDSSGKLKDGEMPNNGTISQTMDGVNTKSITVPAGYTSGGSVSLDSTIDNAVAAMKTALTDKGVTVPSDADALDIASLIAAIEAGGGVTVENYTMYSGQFTLASDNMTGTFSIPDTIGITPNSSNKWFLVIMMSNEILSVVNDYKYDIVTLTFMHNGVYVGDVSYVNGSGSLSFSAKKLSTYDENSGILTIGGAGYYNWRTRHTYNWIYGEMIT